MPGAPQGLTLLTGEIMTRAYRELPYEGRAYPLLELAPRQAYDFGKILWDHIVGEQGMAYLSTLDDTGTLIARDSVKQGTAEPFHMQEGIRLKQSELSRLREPGTDLVAALRLVGPSQQKLRDRQFKRMHWSLATMLQTGALSYNGAGAFDGPAVSVSYGLQNLTNPSTSWSNAAATIVQDIFNWLNEFATQNNGVPPTHVFFNPKIFAAYFLKNTEWTGWVKSAPELATAVLRGEGGPFRIAGMDLVWVPIRSRHTNDSGVTGDLWAQDVLSFAQIDGAPFAEMACEKNTKNDYSASPTSWQAEGTGGDKGSVTVWAYDNGIPVLYDTKRVQIVADLTP